MTAGLIRSSRVGGLSGTFLVVQMMYLYGGMPSLATSGMDLMTIQWSEFPRP